jgi:hypothetical protein
MGMYDDIVEMVSGHLRFEGFPDHLTIGHLPEAQEELVQKTTRTGRARI